jgi:predicted amidophosphoribosyltransferase
MNGTPQDPDSSEQEVFQAPAIPAVALFKWWRSKRRTCPFCAERIRMEATVCPRCGRDITDYFAKDP